MAVLFLPLALATLVWPAVSHWCRRLVETLAALILSKFVIVATLSLAVGALASGTAGTGNHGAGFSSVLAGGALLLMATFVPFVILRMIPAVEAGAVAHLDGLRERGVAGTTRLPRTAANFALHEGLGMVGDSRLMAGTAAASGWVAVWAAVAASGMAMGPGTMAPAMAPPGRARARASPRAPVIRLRNGTTRRAWPRASGLGPRDPSPSWRHRHRARVAGCRRCGCRRRGAGGARVARRSAAATGFEPDPADRVGARKLGGLGARLGPDTKEDAWMWAGVPPGGSLVRRYEPGERRYYMADDGVRPSSRCRGRGRRARAPTT